nr:unnamed protein product [Callosobruchus analis]
MVVAASLVYYRKILVQTVNTIRRDFRPIAAMDPALMERMQIRRLYANIQSISLLAGYFLIHWYGCTPTSEGEEYYMYYRTLPKHIFKTGSPFIYISYSIYYFAITVLALASYVLSAGLLYIVLMINFQYHLLVDDLINKVHIYQGVFELMNNSYYQGIIYKKLKQTVKDFRITEEVFKKFETFNGKIMLNINPPGKFKLCFILTVQAYTYITFASLGQELTDAVSRLRGFWVPQI